MHRPAGFEDTQFFGISIADWVKTIHHKLVNQRSENEEELEYVIAADDYGFDSYACVIGAILSNIQMQDIMDSLKGTLNINSFIELAHDAWSKCYIHWKNIKHEELSTHYEESINTVERNDKATLYAANLVADDQQLYKDIIHEAFAILSVKVLEAGMHNVAI